MSRYVVYIKLFLINRAQISSQLVTALRNISNDTDKCITHEPRWKMGPGTMLDSQRECPPTL